MIGSFSASNIRAATTIAVIAPNCAFFLDIIVAFDDGVRRRENVFFQRNDKHDGKFQPFYGVYRRKRNAVAVVDFVGVRDKRDHSQKIFYGFPERFLRTANVALLLS